MFNIQGKELVIIALLALIVLGPEKLPEVFRKVGEFVGQLRKMSAGFQQEFNSVIDEPTKELRDTVNLVRDAAKTNPVSKTISSIGDTITKGPLSEPTRPTKTDDASSATPLASSDDEGDPSDDVGKLSDAEPAPDPFINSSAAVPVTKPADPLPDDATGDAELDEDIR
ncbi:MAG: twin-arginine translocase subunit TatB [Ilumatobacter coccineus]|uniref:Sec-independent protein translocase protein TatB n=1 Tax=Ilumatobacter coccineus TaxID=467094 RepID=A0A2G6K7K8_9ACTN|nr:MAG: twin-arginine translocase subunit TatB [Ilumatobacter coccineus]